MVELIVGLKSGVGELMDLKSGVDTKYEGIILSSFVCRIVCLGWR